VQVFTADIIYHLHDQYQRFLATFLEARRERARQTAVFPCILEIMPQHIINAKDPIILSAERSGCPVGSFCPQGASPEPPYV